MSNERRRFGPTVAALVAGLLLASMLACGAAVTPVTSLPTPPGGPPSSPAPPTTARAWSEAALWPGGTVPIAGDVVTIAPGDAVLLDVSPPPLGGLMLMGDLVFDRRDLELRSAWIMVHGGLYVGSADEPFTHGATITLDGAPGSDDVHGMGTAVLGVMDGVLAVHGASPGPSWTRLNAHARPGDTVVSVEDATGWAPGDVVVIASTDFEAWEGATGSPEARDRQVEERVLVAVDGTRLTLDRPLAFHHVGEAETVAGVRVDARAEVVRLSRRVVIQGHPETVDPTSERFAFGAHVMAMGSSVVHLHGVEMRRMGQLGALGRYPVHWHLMGDQGSGSAMTRSSIHGSFNRCVTIHGTNGVWIEDVVAYDAIGHCFFFEDGVERGNVVHRSVALMIERPSADDALLASDRHHLGPAAFWITNPDNVLIGNVAASSQGTGFWFALPEHPTGPSYDLFDGAGVWPRHTPLGRFAANVAHSNGSIGLHVDNGPTADLSGVPPTWYRPRSVPADPASAPVTAVFEDFVAYKHRNAGAWFRGDHAVLRGGVLADNAVGVTFASRASGAEGVAFVGETSNVGSPRPWEETGSGGRTLPRFWDPSFAIRGFEFYDGDVYVVDSTFVAFAPDGVRPASALAYLDFTAFAVSPRNAAENLTFGPGTNRVYLASRAPQADQPADGYRSAVFVDVDGSVTGTAGRTVTVNSPFSAGPGCSLRSDWNAYVCPGRYAALTLEDVTGTGGFAPVTLERDDGPEHVMLGTPSEHRSFRAIVRLDRDHTFAHAGSAEHVRVHLNDVEDGDAMLVALPWPGATPFVYRDWWIDDRNLLPTHDSLASLTASSGAGVFHDGATLHARLAVQEGRDYAQIEVCAARGCP